MTVTSTITRKDYVLDGVVLTYPYDFKIFSATDLEVKKKSIAGIETTLTLTTDYSVTGAGTDIGGNVVLVSAGTAGETLVIRRNIPLTQLTSFRNQRDFFAERHEDAYDRATMQIQQQTEESNRAITLPATFTGTSNLVTILPGYAVGIDALGNVAMVPNTGANQSADLASTTDPAKGDALMGVKSAFAGAVATTQDEVNSRHLEVRSASPYADIQAALNYAATKVITNSNPDSQEAGGATFYLPSGISDIDDTLVIAPGVSMVCDGKTAAVIRNLTTDKTLIRNSLGAVYNAMGSTIENIALYGSRTSAAQYGIDLLRPLNCTVRNVYIQNCGAAGVRLRQALSCTLEQVDCALNVGPGFILGGGVVSWLDGTPNSYATNNCDLVMCHSNRNDGAGIRLDAFANGNTIRGGAYENNYYSGGDNVGYNIEILNTGSTMPNEFIDVWAEGPVEAHVYQNAIGVTNRFTRLHHYSNGAAGNVDRAVICAAGTLLLDSPFGQASSYKNISSSIAPFRLVKAGPGLIFVTDAAGSTLTDAGPWIEDETGATTGLINYMKLDNHGYHFGNHKFVSGNYAHNLEVQKEGVANPFFQVDSYQRGLLLSVDDGATAANILVRACWNTPEGAITAPVGSIALRGNGGAGTTLYVKESGTGNTGWVAK